MPKHTEIEFQGDTITLHFIGEPIPPVKKALKNNGFKNSKGAYTAKITENNRFFVKLLAGNYLKG